MIGDVCHGRQMVVILCMSFIWYLCSNLVSGSGATFEIKIRITVFKDTSPLPQEDSLLAGSPTLALAQSPFYSVFSSILGHRAGSDTFLAAHNLVEEIRVGPH